MQIWVVLQVAADAGPLQSGGKAIFLQFVRRTDARTQQHGRGMDRAGADNDFARANVLAASVMRDGRAAGFQAVKAQRGGSRLGQDFEVWPTAHGGSQVGPCARRARRQVLAQRHREKTLARLLVDVLNRRQALRVGCALDGSDESRPLVPRQTSNGIRAWLGMALVATEVVFQLAVIRQHVRPAPAVGAGGYPCVEVGRQAAQPPQTHHARSAAHDAGVRKWPDKTAGWLDSLQAGPEIVAIER